MSKTSYFRFLTSCLKFSIVYMSAEALIHFSNIRLLGLDQFWPKPAIFFLQEFMFLWATASVFSVLVLTYLHQHLLTNTKLIVLTGYFALFHSLVLIYISRIPYESILPTPASHFWIPQYHWWLRFEALLLLLYSCFIYYGRRRQYLP